VAEQRAEAAGKDKAIATAGAWGEACTALSGEAELFTRVALSAAMGVNASRLINRARITDEVVPIRYFADGLAVRPGHGDGPSTHFHQDYLPQSQDRVGAINVWISLAGVGPTQGGMNFLTGSHREGRLGSLYTNGMPDARDPANRRPVLSDLRYDKLADLYQLSPGVEYQPGDATVHNSHTIHCAPANLSDRPRWNYLVSYMPDDVRYDGSRNHVLDALNLTPGQRFEHERFPIVYP
jgi:ectoine hydroxylase-related dioxygenase (phytanoyl-CoA dioxygenase family)